LKAIPILVLQQGGVQETLITPRKQKAQQLQVAMVLAELHRVVMMFVIFQAIYLKQLRLTQL
jgi:hypothetical protein